METNGTIQIIDCNEILIALFGATIPRNDIELLKVDSSVKPG